MHGDRILKLPHQQWLSYVVVGCWVVRFDTYLHSAFSTYCMHAFFAKRSETGTDCSDVI